MDIRYIKVYSSVSNHAFTSFSDIPQKLEAGVNFLHCRDIGIVSDFVEELRSTDQVYVGTRLGGSLTLNIASSHSLASKTR